MRTIHVVLMILVALLFSNARTKKLTSIRLRQKKMDQLTDPTIVEEFERSYHQNKEKTILEAIKILIEDMHLKNITLLASQNVYHLDGTLKEIRTVELSIPEYDVDEILFEDVQPEVIDKVTARQLQGFNFELYTSEYVESDFLETLYMPDGLSVFSTDEVILINQTIHVKDVNELESDYKSRCKICENSTLTSRLAFDGNGKVISSKSSVVPELFAEIESFDGEPGADIVETALNKFVTTVQEAEDLNDVPETLRNILQNKYPDVSFIISTDAVGSYYMKNDFSMEMVYDYLYRTDDLKLTVYGYNTTYDA